MKGVRHFFALHRGKSEVDKASPEKGIDFWSEGYAEKEAMTDFFSGV